jgi:putative ABC transport system ATP-binding protein
MLKLSALTLGYNQQALVKIKDFSLKQGEECLITGASGSGKTTLLYTIAGLLPPVSGSIFVGNTEIQSLNESARDQFRGKHIGIIFQTLHLVKSLTVLENILLSSYLINQPQQQERAIAVLEKLGIVEKRNLLPSDLSQGQQQRVAIARAVFNKPSLILADEPTASLDDIAAENTITLLKQVAAEHKVTLVIATHDARVKAQFKKVIAL